MASRCCGAVLALAAASTDAADTPIAEQAAESVALAQRQTERAPALTPEVSAVRTRLGTTMVPALQLPDGRAATDLAGVDYRLWMTRGRAGVGVEWKPAKSRFGFEGGRLALQLDSGYKLSLRARKGGIGLYLRGQF